MGGCAIPFCNNSAAKGYMMKVFPKNPIRRAEWLKNIPTSNNNWKLNKYSRICEIHFAPEMWINNNKRKNLKRDAIPTVFGFFLKKQNIENDSEYRNDEAIENIATEEVMHISAASTSAVNFAPEMSDSNNKHKNIKREVIPIVSGQQNIENDSECRTDEAIEDIATEEVKHDISAPSTSAVNFAPEMLDSNNKHINIKRQVIPIVSGQQNIENDSECRNDEAIEDIATEEVMHAISASNTSAVNFSYATTNKNTIKEYNKLQELARKQYLQLFVMRRKVKALQNSYRILRHAHMHSHDNDKYKKALSEIFSEDQINVLVKKTRVRNWSNETIQRALKLKSACGVNGYEELLHQGIPLPSIRTLSRIKKSENNNIIKEIC